MNSYTGCFGGFPERGYMIIKKNPTEDESLKYEYKIQSESAGTNDSVLLIFTGMGSQWSGMGKDFMSVKTFAHLIHRSANVLKPYQIDLLNLLVTENYNTVTNDVKSAFIVIAAVQMALYDVIKVLNIKINGTIGHSFGEIACAYANGCLTLEQAMLTSYWSGKVVEDSALQKGMLAAVGLSWDEVKKKCPNGVMRACHNGYDFVPISGLYDQIKRFIKQLINLDIVSRNKCPDLDYFVAFSSVTSGRGNAGQTNYGYANSVMERICEERKRKGIPGMAIQWGVIGDVGVVAEQLQSDESRSGMKQFEGLLLQRMPSFFQVLDRFLQLPYPIVSCFVKNYNIQENEKSDDNIFKKHYDDLGFDKRSPHETLGDIGIDSMTAVRFQEIFERDYGISFELSDIRILTFEELKKFKNGNHESLKQYSNVLKIVRNNLMQMKYELSIEPLTLLNKNKIGKPIYVLPPVEGSFKRFENSQRILTVL